MFVIESYSYDVPHLENRRKLFKRKTDGDEWVIGK